MVGFNSTVSNTVGLLRSACIGCPDSFANCAENCNVLIGHPDRCFATCAATSVSMPRHVLNCMMRLNDPCPSDLPYCSNSCEYIISPRECRATCTNPDFAFTSAILYASVVLCCAVAILVVIIRCCRNRCNSDRHRNRQIPAVYPAAFETTTIIIRPSLYDGTGPNGPVRWQTGVPCETRYQIGTAIPSDPASLAAVLARSAAAPTAEAAGWVPMPDPHVTQAAQPRDPTRDDSPFNASQRYQHGIVESAVRVSEPSRPGTPPRTTDDAARVSLHDPRDVGALQSVQSELMTMALPVEAPPSPLPTA